MSGLVSTMIVFVTLMVLGYVLVRSGTLSKYFAKDASKLVMNVLICSTIVNSVLHSDAMSGSELVKALGIISLSYVLFYVIARLLCRLVSPTKEQSMVCMLLMAVNNTVFIGMPVAEQLFGQLGSFYIALGCIPFNVILYSYGIICLKSEDKKENGGIKFKDMISPPLIATLIGMAIFVTKLQLPDVVLRIVGTLSNATLPMSMFVIGAAMSGVSLLSAFKKPVFYLISFVRLIVSPVLTWAIFRFITNDPVLLGSMVIAAACPSAVMVTSICLQFDKDGVFPSECILLDTLLSMFTIPVITALLL